MTINCPVWVLIFEDVIYFIMLIAWIWFAYITNWRFFSLDVKITFIFALYDKNSSHFLCQINSDYWNYLILTLYLIIPDWYGVYNSKRRYFNTTFYEEIPCRLVNTAVKILTHLSHSDLLGKKRCHVLLAYCQGV